MPILFADRLEEFGDNPAVVSDSGITLSYRELARRADVFRESLPDDRKLIVVESLNELPPLIAYLGALRGRHPVILVEDGATAKDARIVETFRPYGIFRRQDGNWQLELDRQDSKLPLHADLAVLLSTSGSSGSAKLVRLSRENIGTNADAIVEYLELHAGERAITSLPFHYSYGLSVINSHLAVGATLLLTGESVTSPAFWDFFRDQRGTSFAAVPYTFDLLDRTGFREMDLPTLRGMTQAGGRLARDKVLTYARWCENRSVRFYVMYGQTEAAPRMAFVPPKLLLEHAGCIGQAIPGGLFEIVDESGREIREPDEAGELVYRGPNVMMGYALRAEDLAKGPEVSELRTGDLACRNKAGLYYIVGRKSRFSKLFGLRIGLDDVEAFLAGNGIGAVAAGDDTRIVVCTLTRGAARDISELLAGRYGLGASAFVVLERNEYPLLPSGKIDYRAILQDGIANTTENQPAGRVNATGKTALREMFRWSLGTEEIHDSDSFAALGGDSLSYVEVSLAIEKYLGYLPKNWEDMAIGEIENLSVQRSGAIGLDTDIVLRVVAVIAIIAEHASNLLIAGGTEVLMMLAGLSLARFHKNKLFAGNPTPIIFQYLANIILPYYLITLAYFGAFGKIGIPALLLVSTLFLHTNALLPYWFLEVLFQSVLVFSALFLVGPFRQWARNNPWASGCAITAAGAALYLLAPFMLDANAHGIRIITATFYIFAFGWSLAFTTTRTQKLVMTGIAAAFVAYLFLFPMKPEWTSRALWILAGSGLMLWTTRIPVPAFLRSTVTTIGAASFYIYTVQIIPLKLLVPEPNWTEIPEVVVSSVGLGIAMWWAVRLMYNSLAKFQPYARWRRKTIASVPRRQKLDGIG
jgi:acyl-coenzyme A synthetase/AMP-(fatty) acid ligase